jgi:hypothetical protein
MKERTVVIDDDGVAGPRNRRFALRCDMPV